MKTNLTTLIFAIAFLVLLTAFASATVSELNNIKYGIIEDNSSLTTTNTPISGSNVLGLVCLTSNCSSVSNTLFSNLISSPSTTLTYPSQLLNKGYGLFFFKDGYIPYEVKVTYAGSGNAPTATDYLTRKASCSSYLSDLVASNNNGFVTVRANVQSPLSNAGPLDYIPIEIASQYTVDVDLNLKITGASNYSELRKVGLSFSTTKNVLFTVNLAPGNYSVSLTSSTSDLKCLSSANKTKSTTLNVEPIACNSDLDCGLSGLIGNPFCSSSSVVSQNYQSFTCNNAGTTQSFCSNSTSENIIKTCSTNELCSSGSCQSSPIDITITHPTQGENITNNNGIPLNYTITGNPDSCWYSIDNGINVSLPQCRDSSFNLSNGAHSITVYANNSLGIIFPSNEVNFNVNSPIACTSNSDCGTDGLIDGPYCSVKNVLQNYQTFLCHNAGHVNSYCSNSTAPKLIQSCSILCSNGLCINQTNQTALYNISLTRPQENEAFDTTTNIPLQFIINGYANSCWFTLDNSTNNPIQCQNTVFSASEGDHTITVFASNSTLTVSDSKSFSIILSNNDNGGGNGNGNTNNKTNVITSGSNILFYPAQTKTVKEDNSTLVLNTAQNIPESNTSNSFWFILGLIILILLILIIAIVFLMLKKK